MKTLTKILLLIGAVLGVTGFLYIAPIKELNYAIYLANTVLWIGITLIGTAIYFHEDNKSKSNRVLMLGGSTIYIAIIIFLAKKMSIQPIIPIIFLVIAATLIISTALFNIVNIVQEKKKKD